MNHAWMVLAAWALVSVAVAEPLTLEAALATATAPHPTWRIAESDLALAQAERQRVDSERDIRVVLDGSLRSGQRPGGDWKPDNIARLVVRKPLFDFGRSEQARAASGQEVIAGQLALFGVESLRRLDIMARYFDVLLADRRYAVDNEFMAVAFVAQDQARERFEVGQLSRPRWLELQAQFQDARERLNASLQALRSTRQKLAHALNRSDAVADDLVEPGLADNDRALPDYAALLAWVHEHNPRVRVLRARLAAVDARLAVAAAERYPTLDAEVVGAGYSRESVTRDELSAGLVFSIPLYQGGRVDALSARERAARAALLAEIDQTRFELADTVLTTVQEIEWLRDSARVAADTQIEYRDWALERARAEYELELKTNLGTNMVETQVAQLRRKQVEYRLALAWARLEAMAGGTWPVITGATP